MASRIYNPSREDRDDILAREIIKESAGEKDPETALAEEFLAEINLRMEQVKMYFPIMEILRKRKQDAFNELIPEFCFLLLSYLIYEGKLKHRGISFEQIETYLWKALKVIRSQECGQEEIRDLTGELLDTLQNGGRNFLLEVYQFKTGSYREKYIKLLEIKQSDEGKLLYHITDQGVDFYLKTKEFPEETKITMNLLLFQKQMEKGAFGFAYETVRRLNMEVQKKKDRKYSLLEALMVGRLDSGEAYNEYHRSIVLQFEEESELFDTAMKNVSQAYGEYVERIQNGEAAAREQRAFQLIKIIEKEIGKAQTLHTELLREAVGFTGEYDKALEMRRKTIFTERFHFQGEFDKILDNKGNPENLKYFFEPLLMPRMAKSFNPLRAFEMQRLFRGRQEELDGNEEEVGVERKTLDLVTRSRVRKSFVFYAKELIMALQEPHPVSLEEFSRRLTGKYAEDAVYNGDFLSFLLEMNREKEPGSQIRTIRLDSGDLKPESELKTIEEIFLKAAVGLSPGTSFHRITVQSFPEEELELLPGLKITNMVFAGEGK